MGYCGDLGAALVRRKTISIDNMETKLNRCYGVSDLIMMGIGFMVGTGIFVLSGEVVKYEAGTAGIVSFLLAGLAAMLSALCFAEFGGMVPISGSGYMYTYVTVGEVYGFTVGWSMILEYVIGAASAAKAFSGTLDSLCNYSISTGISESVGTFNSSFLSPYPDFISLLIVILVAIFVCISAQTSSMFNKIMVTIKLITIAIIIIAGIMVSDVSNWTDPQKGGFAPYGVSGIFTGAATCFYAYVGFDGISIASEETKNPKKTVPISIVVSMVIVTLLYVLTTIVLTLMVPYDEVVAASPFSSAFLQKGMPWAEYVVGVGTMIGLTTVILSGLYSLPRLLYAMANDGLIFSSLSVVNSTTRTPMLTITIAGFLAGLLAFFIDLTVLVELLSIGTLLSFTFVAACVIMLRYDASRTANMRSNELDLPMTESLPLSSTGSEVPNYSGRDETDAASTRSDQSLVQSDQKEGFIAKYKSEVNNYARKYSVSMFVIISLLIMVICSIAFLLMLILAFDRVKSGTWWAILVLVITSLGVVVPVLLIGSLEQVHKSVSSFQVPWVPLLPAVSIFFNIGLMLMLDPWTWVRLAVWLALGFVIYFGYGVRHSREAEHKPADDPTS